MTDPLCGKTPTAMASYLRSCGSETGDAIAAMLQRQQTAIELAYGLLWQARVDKRDPDGLATALARGVLLDILDNDSQGRALQAGRLAFRDALDEPRKNPRTVPSPQPKYWKSGQKMPPE